MTIPVYSQRVTIGGVETAVFSMSSSFATKQPVGTCSLSIPIPPAAHIVEGAAVVVEWAVDGVDWDDPIFVGTVPPLDRSLTVNGAVGTLACEDKAARRLTFPLEVDKAFVGGAKAAPQNLITAATHLGDDTIAWYDDTTPVGITHDVTVTPTATTNFVWITLDLHGTNSYDESIGDRKIKTWSRIVLFQNGEEIGRANLPESNESWTDELDYTDRDNWDEDVEIFIAAPIVEADGDVIFRFYSGLKPGSSQRDEYEVDDVTWQTAGTNTLRQIVRGICKMCGLTTGQYDVAEIKSLTGSTIRLGGNGLVNAGQIVISATDVPLTWLNRLLNLFGAFFFSCPDGKMRGRAIRGEPTGTPVATFTEGTNIFALPTVTRNQRPYNSVLVEGAAGNDQNGKRFAYSYQTSDIDVVPHVLIPDPPGIAMLRAPGGEELTSNTLCQYVGKIAELENGDWVQIDGLEVIPVWLRPGNIIAVDAPTAEVDSSFWTTGVRYETDESGDFRVTLSARAGSAEPFGEEDDPDPAEVDVEPGARRPSLEWVPFDPSAVVA